MADVANLEAAFERTTIHDENDEHTASNAAYQKAKKVCIRPRLGCQPL
jgi:aurora kinase